MDGDYNMKITISTADNGCVLEFANPMDGEFVREVYELDDSDDKIYKESAAKLFCRLRDILITQNAKDLYRLQIFVGLP